MADDPKPTVTGAAAKADDKKEDPTPPAAKPAAAAPVKPATSDAEDYLKAWVRRELELALQGHSPQSRVHMNP